MIYYKRISQITGRKLVLLHLFAKLIQPGNRCFIFEERYMNSVKRLLLSLTKFEWFLWIASSLVIGVSYLASPNRDVLTIIDSLIGVTALIFIAKGICHRANLRGCICRTLRHHSLLLPLLRRNDNLSLHDRADSRVDRDCVDKASVQGLK